MSHLLSLSLSPTLLALLFFLKCLPADVLYIYLLTAFPTRKKSLLDPQCLAHGRHSIFLEQVLTMCQVLTLTLRKIQEPLYLISPISEVGTIFITITVISDSQMKKQRHGEVE